MVEVKLMLVEVCFHRTDKGLEQVDIKVEFPDRPDLNLNCEIGQGQFFTLNQEPALELFTFSNFWSLLNSSVEVSKEAILSQQLEVSLIKKKNEQRKEFFHQRVNRARLKEVLKRETQDIFSQPA